MSYCLPLIIFVVLCYCSYNVDSLPMSDGVDVTQNLSSAVVKKENNIDNLSPITIWSRSLKNNDFQDPKSEYSADLYGERSSIFKGNEEIEGASSKFEKLTANSENDNLETIVSLPPEPMPLKLPSVHTKENYSQNTFNVENCDQCQCVPERDYIVEKCKHCPPCESIVLSKRSLDSLSGEIVGFSLKNEDGVSNVNTETDLRVLHVNCDLCHCPVEKSYSPEKCKLCPCESQSTVEVETEISGGHDYNVTSAVPESDKFPVTKSPDDLISPTTIIDKTTTIVEKTTDITSPSIAKHSNVILLAFVILLFLLLVILIISSLTYKRVKLWYLRRYYF